MASSETTGGAAAARKAPTQEERDNLLVHHVGKLRLAMAEVEEAREPLTAAQQALTALFNEAKADLGKGYSRKYLQVLVIDSQARARDLVDEEKRRAHDKAVLGQPVFGVQQDLFGAENDATPQEAKDAIAIEADGYLAGRRAAERKPPKGSPPRFDQDWLRGFDRGQEENGRRFLAAQELIAKRGQPDATAASAPLNASPEPTVAEARVAETRSVGRARASLTAMNGGKAEPQPAA